MFGVNDIETTNLVSRMDAHDATSSWNSPNLPWTPPGHISSEHVVARDLITPDEIIQLPSETMILLSTGQRPALARKIRYYVDPEFQKLFDPS